MDTWMIVVAVIVFLCIIFVRSQVKAAKKFNQAIAAIPNFTPSAALAPTYAEYGIAIDANQRLIAVMRSASLAALFSSSELVACEVIRDGDSIQRTNRGSQALGAVAGGLVLGPAGLLLGGLTGSKRTSEKVKSLSLRIFTKNMALPVFDIVFFKSPGSKPDDPAVKLAADALTQWHGRIRALIAT